MKKKGKLIRNLIIFILLIVLTFTIIFKDNNFFDIFSIMKNAKLEFILIGIVAMCIYLCLEAINIGRTLTMLGEKSTFLKNLKYAAIGFFFSAVTPAASGGQPMQIYYMSKDDIAVSSSTIALLLNLTSMQIITISMALVSVFFFYQYLNSALIIFFVIGIMLNLSALILLLVSIFSEKLSKGIIDFVIKLLKFFKVRNIESKKEKLNNELEKYQKSAIFVRNNRGHLLKIILTTLIQFTIYYSITYWTYRALGFNQSNIITIIALQSLVYATVSGIPSPGAVGVSEGAFMQIFKTIYPENMISSAVLLNRGINFYLFVIICAIITIINQMKMKDNNDIEETINNE